MSDSHPLVSAAAFVYQAQPLEEQAVIRNQRKAALRYFQITREKLATDPTATAGDLETLDYYVRWSEAKLNKDDDRADRRREKTRERVRRHRAAKAVTRRTQSQP